MKITIDDILHTYKIVKVNKVIDGDTIDCNVDLGFNIILRIKVRLEDIDTPEIYHPETPQEREAGIKCKNYLKHLLKQNKNKLYITTKKTGKYGRWLGTIYICDGENRISVNELIKRYMEENKYTKEKVRKVTK